MAGHRSQRLLLSVSQVTALKILAEGFTFLLFILLSRVYGPDGVGRYSLATVLGAFLLVAAQAGLYSLCLKEVPRLVGAARVDYLQSLMATRLVTLGMTSVILVATAYAYPLTDENRLLWLSIGFFQLLSAFILGSSATLLATGHISEAGILEVLQKLLIFVATSALIMLDLSLEIAVLAMPFASLAVAIWAFTSERRNTGLIKPSFAPKAVRIHLRNAQPFFQALFIDRIARRTDIVLIGHFVGAVAVGEYNAAFRILFLFNLLSAQASAVVFPVASERSLASRSGGPAPDPFISNALSIAFIIGIPSAVGVWLLSEEITLFLYGSDFASSARILAVASVIIPFTLVRHVASILLQANNYEGYWSRVMQVTAVLSVGGVSFGVLSFGVLGVVAAMILVEIASTSLVIWRLGHLIRLRMVVYRLVICSIAVVCMALPVQLTAEFNILARIVIGFVTYFSILMAFSTMRTTLIQSLRHSSSHT